MERSRYRGQLLLSGSDQDKVASNEVERFCLQTYLLFVPDLIGTGFETKKVTNLPAYLR